MRDAGDALNSGGLAKETFSIAKGASFTSFV